jgi:hypothetical protein
VRPAAARPLVYYVVVDVRLVKIGWTSDLPRRIREIDAHYADPVGPPVTLVAAEPCPSVEIARDLEVRRHDQFATLRVRRREVFTLTATLIDHVDALRAFYRWPPRSLPARDVDYAGVALLRPYERSLSPDR